MELTNKETKYVIEVDGEIVGDFTTLRSARDLIRNMINVFAVRQEKKSITLSKVVTKKTVMNVYSPVESVGNVEEVFLNMEE